MQCPSTAVTNIHMDRGRVEQTQEKEILVGDLRLPMVLCVLDKRREMKSLSIALQL